MQTQDCWGKQSTHFEIRSCMGRIVTAIRFNRVRCWPRITHCRIGARFFERWLGEPSTTSGANCCSWDRKRHTPQVVLKLGGHSKTTSSAMIRIQFGSAPGPFGSSLAGCLRGANKTSIVPQQPPGLYRTPRRHHSAEARTHSSISGPHLPTLMHRLMARS
jgi:hypothetical protein